MPNLNGVWNTCRGTYIGGNAQRQENTTITPGKPSETLCGRHRSQQSALFAYALDRLPKPLVPFVIHCPTFVLCVSQLHLHGPSHFRSKPLRDDMLAESDGDMPPQSFIYFPTCDNISICPGVDGYFSFPHLQSRLGQMNPISAPL